MVSAIDGYAPDPATETDAIKRTNMKNALQYMGLRVNTPIADICPDKIFIGSCTNSRIIFTLIIHIHPIVYHDILRLAALVFCCFVGQTYNF